jgi:hypothetical protein
MSATSRRTVKKKPGAGSGEPQPVDWGLVLHNCITIGLTLADAERLTMPEYLALIHHHELANSADDVGPPPDEAEVSAAFMRMELSGIARVH